MYIIDCYVRTTNDFQYIIELPTLQDHDKKFYEGFMCLQILMLTILFLQSNEAIFLHYMDFKIECEKFKLISIQGFILLVGWMGVPFKEFDNKEHVMEYLIYLSITYLIEISLIIISNHIFNYFYLEYKFRDIFVINDVICPVCLDNSENNWIRLRCNHLYHKRCIGVLIQNNYDSCILCLKKY